MTPQQKKRLSYEKDRRNTRDGSDKAARKLIPKSKALDIRSERHAQDIALAKSLRSHEEDTLLAVELKVRSTKPRQWRKSPDERLGQILARRATKGREHED